MREHDHAHNHLHAFVVNMPLNECHRCLRERGATKDPLWHCPEDREPIHDHAAQRYCPLGRFNLGPGDWLAALLQRLGLRQRLAALAAAYAAEHYRAGRCWMPDGAKAPQDCGCAGRQRRANDIVRQLFTEVLPPIEAASDDPT